MALVQPVFEIGRLYSRREDIHAKFGGSRQSGISPSAEYPAIFVFTGDSGHRHGYKDSFDSAGVFSYTGEGQVGDMTFKSGNKALRDHTKNGKAVLLFSALGKGQPCRFEGDFAVANYQMVRGPDREGNDRDIIIFHMIRADAEDTDSNATDLGADVTDIPSTLEQARLRALRACSAPAGNAGQSAVRVRYQRNLDIKRYVLMRENGRCRGCGEEAPFITVRGEPYLEPHHTTRLSDGGLDHPGHVVGLCPNCHKEVHFGKNGEALNARLIEWLKEYEPI